MKTDSQTMTWVAHACYGFVAVLPGILGVSGCALHDPCDSCSSQCEVYEELDQLWWTPLPVKTATWPDLIFRGRSDYTCDSPVFDCGPGNIDQSSIVTCLPSYPQENIEGLQISVKKTGAYTAVVYAFGGGSIDFDGQCRPVHSVWASEANEFEETWTYDGESTLPSSVTHRSATAGCLSETLFQSPEGRAVSKSLDDECTSENLYVRHYTYEDDQIVGVEIVERGPDGNPVTVRHRISYAPTGPSEVAVEVESGLVVKRFVPYPGAYPCCFPDTEYPYCPPFGATEGQPLDAPPFL